MDEETVFSLSAPHSFLKEILLMDLNFTLEDGIIENNRYPM